MPDVKWTMRSALEQAHELYLIEADLARGRDDAQGENFWTSHADTVARVLEGPTAIRSRVEEEREACARVADAYRQRDNTILVSAAEHIATLIRARGKR